MIACRAQLSAAADWVGSEGIMGGTIDTGTSNDCAPGRGAHTKSCDVASFENALACEKGYRGTPTSSGWG